MQANIIGILAITDIFDNLTTSQLESIAAICELQAYQKGQIFLHENESSDDIYAIARGTVEILLNPAIVGEKQESDTESVTLTLLRQGQVVGEVALVDQGIRSATARASQDNTQLLRIPRKQLIALCDTYPDLGYKLMKNLAADLAYKIRSTDLAIRQYHLMLSHKQ
jgi:CRP-like cAMP-binding protein